MARRHSARFIRKSGSPTILSRKISPSPLSSSDLSTPKLPSSAYFFTHLAPFTFFTSSPSKSGSRITTPTTLPANVWLSDASGTSEPPSANADLCARALDAIRPAAMATTIIPSSGGSETSRSEPDPFSARSRRAAATALTVVGMREGRLSLRRGSPVSFWGACAAAAGN
eukprot:CAMPEP_0194333930 /NCGR_PEP_ID=MMETSP0171-20130528/64387_1 /TAXON_ID=218684 /ORGANISM="Corethron pennatum, Strain L29A3" /LENGTH=169 /DNA_ID=CAMNT_0039096361 /DNA_START=273 /DNA_END=782 /DNA_ORIENTATION=-